MSLLTCPSFPSQARPRPRARLDAGILRVCAIAGLATIFAISAAAAPAQRAATNEYDLKAAFLFNFAQFVEWPVESFAKPTTPIVIGVLGDDPFGQSLDEIVAGETVRDRPLVIQRYRSVDQIEACQILFISASEAGRLDQIVKELGHRSTLTVGETAGFAKRSGIIEFALVQRRLRLRINLVAATSAHLTVSSKLLRQAEVVNPDGGRE